MEKKHTFKNYLEASFFKYMHENGICPLTHEGIEFYFGKIYERYFDKYDHLFKFYIRGDLSFLIQEAKDMQANEVKLEFTHGRPHIAAGTMGNLFLDSEEGLIEVFEI
tara:strand:- start:62 stop:385 length:324 start_codon:yes stop_codon:yes gene_type:complete